MFGLSLQQVERMRKQTYDGSERFHGSAWTAGQIQNQTYSPHATYAATQRCKLRLLRAFDAHALGHSVEYSIADGPCSFWRHIARRNSRATSGYDQSRASDQVNQSVLNLHGVIGNNFRSRNPKPCFFQRPGDGRTGKIDSFAASAGIAHCQHGR